MHKKLRFQSVVHCLAPSLQSRGAYVLLVKQYKLQDRKPKWVKHLQWRNSIVQRLVDNNVPLTCVYCGKDNLIPFPTHVTPPKEAATLEHVIPKYLGGTSELTNLAIACAHCNNKKSHRKPRKQELQCVRLSTLLNLQ